MRARDRLDLPLQLLVDHQLAPENTGQNRDRTIVVGGSKAAGDDAEIGLEAFPESRLELCRVVADDDDPAWIDAEREQLPGEERPVQVAAVAADELAAGDDDDGPGPCARQAEGGAFLTAVGVTTSFSETPRVYGTGRTLPLSLATRFQGAPAEIQRREKSHGLCVNGSCCPC